jgi:hypothetical protein
LKHCPHCAEVGSVQHTSPLVHTGQMQKPPSACPPEPLSGPPEELLEPPLEEEDAPLDEEEPPLEDEDAPLDDEDPPLEDPLPLAHSLEQCNVEQPISLSPVLREAAEHAHAAVHCASVPPRYKHPTYVSQAVSCAQSHQSASQWLATQSLQRWLLRSGVHAGASGAPPLDEPVASPPFPLPSGPPVDASLPPPPAKGAPPQSAARATAAGKRSRAPTRTERRITKPARIIPHAVRGATVAAPGTTCDARRRSTFLDLNTHPFQVLTYTRRRTPKA